MRRRSICFCITQNLLLFLHALHFLPDWIFKQSQFCCIFCLSSCIFCLFGKKFGGSSGERSTQGSGAPFHACRVQAVTPVAGGAQLVVRRKGAKLDCEPGQYYFLQCNCHGWSCSIFGDQLIPEARGTFPLGGQPAIIKFCGIENFPSVFFLILT